MRAARLWLLILTFALALSLAGCGASGVASDTTPAATPTLTPNPTATISVPARDVTFTTQDGVRLGGKLYGSGGAGVTGVALSHQLGSLQSQWSGFARVLAARGYLVLTFDFRGRGASEGTFDTATEDTDLRAAIRFLRAQGARQIALMGASLGGAVTLRVAATEQVAAVATLSAVAGFPTQPVTDDILKAIKAPKLFINSELDPAASDTQHMYDVSPPPKAIHLYPGNAHGVVIFAEQYGADLTNRLLTFMATYAPAR